MTTTIRFEPKMAVVPFLSLCLASGSLLGAVSQAAGADNLTAQEIVQKSRETYAALTSYSDHGSVTSEMAGQKSTLTFKLRLQRPNLYRVDWALQAKLSMPGQDGAVWSDGHGDYLLNSGVGKDKSGTPQKMADAKSALRAAAGPSWSSSLAIPGLFFNKDFGDARLAVVMSGRSPLVRENDAKIGDTDCYVISSTIDLGKSANGGKEGTESNVVCIGKQDFLIHQSRSKTIQKTQPTAPPSDQEIDAATRKSLEMQNKPTTPEAIAAMRPQMRMIIKQVHSTIKSGYESGVVTTQTHEKIVVNETLAPAVFTAK